MRRLKVTKDSLCHDTYATLCIYSDDATPNVIMKTLGIEPTESFAKGDPFNRGRGQRKFNAWFWSTKHDMDTTDNAAHVDRILSLLSGREHAIRELHAMGCTIRISNYYLSTGHGGPQLEPHQMRARASMNISIWWDVYFKDPDEDAGS